MDITQLVTNELKKVKEKYGKDDSIVNMLEKALTRFGYLVLGEINRLNVPCFTILEDNDYTKQGFVNMMLNYLIDKDDETYGKLKFSEYKAWNDFSVSEPQDKRLLIVELSNGKLDFANYKENQWINQDNIILNDVVKWRSFLPNGYN